MWFDRHVMRTTTPDKTCLSHRSGFLFTAICCRVVASLVLLFLSLSVVVTLQVSVLTVSKEALSVLTQSTVLCIVLTVCTNLFPYIFSCSVHIQTRTQSHTHTHGGNSIAQPSNITSQLDMNKCQANNKKLTQGRQQLWLSTSSLLYFAFICSRHTIYWQPNAIRIATWKLFCCFCEMCHIVFVNPWLCCGLVSCRCRQYKS